MFWVIRLFGRLDPLLTSRSRGPSLSVESDLSALAFSKSTHSQTTRRTPEYKYTLTHKSRGWGGGWSLSTQTTPGSRQPAWSGLMWPRASETLHPQWTRSATCSVPYSTEVGQTIQLQQPTPNIRYILMKDFCSCCCLGCFALAMFCPAVR